MTVLLLNPFEIVDFCFCFFLRKNSRFFFVYYSSPPGFVSPFHTGVRIVAGAGLVWLHIPSSNVLRINSRVASGGWNLTCGSDQFLRVVCVKYTHKNN